MSLHTALFKASNKTGFLKESAYWSPKLNHTDNLLLQSSLLFLNDNQW